MSNLPFSGFNFEAKQVPLVVQMVGRAPVYVAEAERAARAAQSLQNAATRERTTSAKVPPLRPIRLLQYAIPTLLSPEHKEGSMMETFVSGTQTATSRHTASRTWRSGAHAGVVTEDKVVLRCKCLELVLLNNYLKFGIETERLYVPFQCHVACQAHHRSLARWGRGGPPLSGKIQRPNIFDLQARRSTPSVLH